MSPDTGWCRGSGGIVRFAELRVGHRLFLTVNGVALLDPVLVGSLVLMWPVDW